MSSSFFKLITSIFSIIIIIILIFYIPIYSVKSISQEVNFSDNGEPETQILTGEFEWPTPGYTRITSGFGYRKAPTGGASTYHSGIDIGAPQGTNIIAIFSGKVTLAEFKGAGGYTITVEQGEFSVSYCHIDPNFIVKVGDYVR